MAQESQDTCVEPPFWQFRQEGLALDWPAPLSSELVWRTLLRRTTYRNLRPLEYFRKSGLRRLLETTPRKSPDRPLLWVRLGDMYATVSDHAWGAARGRRGAARCKLLGESAEALVYARRTFEEALEEDLLLHGSYRNGWALLWLAALSFPEEPERSVDLLEQLIELSGPHWQIHGRVAFAEVLLTAPEPLRDSQGAVRELEWVASESRGFQSLARHRLAELAWLRGDAQAACQHLRQIDSTIGKENLKYVCDG